MRMLPASEKLFFLAVFYVIISHVHVGAFSFRQPPSTFERHHQKISSLKGISKFRLNSFSYGRGAEIWPECNEDPVSLSDSFPNGQVPYAASLSIEENDMAEVHERVEESVVHAEPRQSSKRKFVSKAVQRILRRAAAKEELDSEDVQSPMDRTPSVIAGFLLLRGLVRPSDALIVSFLTGYFIILGMVARSTRTHSNAPIMPAVPPQGHVPALVSNPLGFSFTYSKIYDTWLKLGVATGLLGPLTMLSWYIYHSNMEAARWCARPIFLLCCQAVSEAFSRRVMAPLPLRILIPIAYNSIRVLYIWNWFTAPTSSAVDIVGRILAGANLFYWSVNLLAFLLPIASIRYMRAHFFGVEAEEVTTRFGMEETVGLIPH